jgi:hypothetical protein
MWLFKSHKTIFSLVDEPPSWSAEDSLESMSDPEEDENDMPDDKDLTCLGIMGEDGDDEGEGDVVVADGVPDVDSNGSTREDEEEHSSNDFLLQVKAPSSAASKTTLSVQ